VTRRAPHRVVWLGGPLSAASPLQPASYRGGPAGPAAGGGVYTAGYEPVYQPPYVSIAPSTPAETAAGDTRRAVAEVLPPATPGGGTAAPTIGPTTGAPAPPPGQAAQQPLVPRVDVALNAATCSTPICTWSVTVTNSGTAPGAATVIASATPGMPPVSHPLGVIPPGDRAQTPPMQFGNPAPPPRPGQTTQVMINYLAQVFSPG
jgi:hypothetical protein